MTGTTDDTPAAMLDKAILEPASKTLESIRREVRGIDPDSEEETRAMAERLNDWSVWGELELYFVDHFGTVDIGERLEGHPWYALIYEMGDDWIYGKFVLVCAILGLPRRMHERVHEFPTQSLAFAIGEWWDRICAKMLEFVDDLGPVDAADGMEV